MGANAQTSVPTFVSGQVLTATQQNLINTGVPVAAGTAERDALFGGSGEKTLAEGQLVYVESLDVVQYYDGSSWGTLAPGGLVYVAGASFTTVTSVSLPDNTFSSTYRNYRVIYNITAVTADADFTLRFRTGGSDETGGDYNNLLLGINTSAAASNVAGGGATAFNVGEHDGSATARYSLVLDVMQPNLAQTKNVHLSYAFVNKANTEVIMRTGVSQFQTATACDSMTFISSVASSITGVYRVYGYADS
jgi:hypothetical protein